MSRSDRLTTFSKQIGFALHDDSGMLTAVGVPCLLNDGTVSTCSITTSYDSANRQPTEQIGNAVHGVRITIAEERDGLVYQADGTPIGNHLAGDGKTWSDISIHKGMEWTSGKRCDGKRPNPSLCQAHHRCSSQSRLL